MAKGTNARPDDPPGVTNDQTSSEPEAFAGRVRNKVIEIAGLLQSEAPEAPMSQEHMYELVRQHAKSGGPVFYAEVLDVFPDVKPGESGGAYAARLIEAVGGGDR